MLLIQSILFFILGVACASFFMLLLAPIIWRRALALSQQAVRMEIPLSLNEVEAEHDFSRAVHAVEICRLEERVVRAKNHEMVARLALDVAQAKICYLAPFEMEAETLQQILIQMRMEAKKLQQENNLQRLKLEKMAQRIQENQQNHSRTKTQKSIIKGLKRQISALKKQLVRLEKQRDALSAAKLERTKREQIENAELSVLRQEIKQIAAQIITNIATRSEDASLMVMVQDGADRDDLAGAIHREITVIESQKSSEGL